MGKQVSVWYQAVRSKTPEALRKQGYEVVCSTLEGNELRCRLGEKLEHLVCVARHHLDAHERRKAICESIDLLQSLAQLDGDSPEYLAAMMRAVEEDMGSHKDGVYVHVVHWDDPSIPDDPDGGEAQK